MTGDRIGCCAQGTADHRYYGATRSLCRVCRDVVDARIVFRDGAVYLDKHCLRHGPQQTLVASSVDWYLDAAGFLAARQPPPQRHRPIAEGCPLDCGLCPAHQQRIVLPVVPITSACNLDCPICYTINRNEGAFRMTTDELDSILEQLATSGGELDIINFTGGEPTLHPQLLPMLEQCRRAGIERLTVSTNGLTLEHPEYLAALHEIDARMIVSVDTFDEETDLALHGVPTLQRKLRALDLLGEHEVTTTILPTIAAGYNDRDLAALLELVLGRPNIVSLEIHTLCFTGQGGARFPRQARITVPDVHRLLEQCTAGAIRGSDFVPSPLAHPHCYSICYLLMLEDGRGYLPFTRLMGRRRLYELLADSLYLEPRQILEQVLLEVIDELWASPDPPAEIEDVLRTLKQLIGKVFPADGRSLSLAERRRIGERSVKAIYIHSHMDEESFDVSRVMACCVGVPGSDGSAIPTCAYNVLYRQQDQRFTDPRRPPSCACEAE